MPHYRVTTRYHLKRRRRAGFDFSPVPRVVEVAAGSAEEKALVGDDALDAQRLSEAEAAALIADLPEASPDMSPDARRAFSDLRDELERANARIADLERAVAGVEPTGDGFGGDAQPGAPVRTRRGGRHE